MPGPFDDFISGGTDTSQGGDRFISRLTYPNPFFDLSRFYMPKTVKALFKYCRWFFWSNEFVHNVITKMTEYPITDVLFETGLDQEIKEKYEKLFNHTLKLKKLLIEIGLDYYTFGNCFISAHMKFKRFLTCPKCKHTDPIANFSYKFQDFKFKGTCPKCTEMVTFKPEDKYLTTPEFFKFIRWAPENITIDYDELTGESRYFYQINEQTKAGIIAGKKEVVERVPLLFIESLQQKKKIELDVNNLWHLKRPTLAEEDRGWGKPLILPAMKMLYYMQTLRRGNEAIVADHLIPNRAIFPSSQGNVDHFTMLNLGQWRANVEDQILKWRRDSNHIGIFPIPIGYQSLGGDAKVLMVTPEMAYLEESIINSFGFPTEFIKGGATWTSASVSLRIIENMFMAYREMLIDMINYFMLPKIETFLKFAPIKLKFKKLKMSDDPQAKELLILLANAGKISDTMLLEEFGIDVDQNRIALKSDTKFNNELLISKGEAQTEMAARGLVIEAKWKARAELAYAEEKQRIQERMFEKQLNEENGLTGQDPSEIIMRIAQKLSQMDEKEQKQELETLRLKRPVTFGFVMQRLEAGKKKTK
jgi:hypothetical protein